MKKAGALYCLDWEQLGLEVNGNWEGGSDWSAIEIAVYPCGQKITSTDESARDNCNWDKQTAIDYFDGGTINLYRYNNYDSFQQDEFGTERIVRKSGLHGYLMDVEYPSWIHASI